MISFAVAYNITAIGYKPSFTKLAAGQTFEFTPAVPIELMNAPIFRMFSTEFQDLQSVTLTTEPTA